MVSANNNELNRYILVIDDPRELVQGSNRDAETMYSGLYIEDHAYKNFNLPDIESYLRLTAELLEITPHFDPDDTRMASRVESVLFQVKQPGNWTRYYYRRSYSQPVELLYGSTHGGIVSPRPCGKPYEEDRDVMRWALRIDEDNKIIREDRRTCTISAKRWIELGDLYITQRREDDPTYINAWNIIRLWILNQYISNFSRKEEYIRDKYAPFVCGVLREIRRRSGERPRRTIHPPPVRR
jgi:hypothetical protein